MIATIVASCLLLYACLTYFCSWTQSMAREYQRANQLEILAVLYVIAAVILLK